MHFSLVTIIKIVITYLVLRYSYTSLEKSSTYGLIAVFFNAL